MAKTHRDSLSEQATQHPKTLGNYGHQVIEQQYHRIVKQEQKVLADKDPEPLHQMRVGTRRLRTALQVFGSAIDVPKAGGAERLRKLAKVLGEVRDLDVQMASLQEEYYPNLNKQEQKQLDKVCKALTAQRKQAFANMEQTLTQSLYEGMKKTYVKWLKQPRYAPIAQLPLSVVLPDLLSPLLSELLLHPGWLISVEQVADQNSNSDASSDHADSNSVILHDLRKACKHVRYQAEFFTPFYREEFENWIDEIKTLQDQLGDFQDSQVFLELIAGILGDKDLPNLQELVRQKRRKALSNWDEIRHKYLDHGFRYHLHQMLLQPIDKAGNVHPELIEQDKEPK